MQPTSWFRNAVLIFLACRVCYSAPPDDVSTFDSRTYQVADLVVPMSTESAFVVPPEKQAMDEPELQFEPLIRHLKSVSGTSNWSQGKGEIAASASTRSLVIQQTPAVHDRIVAELKRLRQEQDLQLTQEVTIVTGPRKEIAALAAAFPGELGRFERQELGQEIQKSANLTIVMAPKITTFNRQVGTIKFESKVLASYATVDTDHRSIQLKVSYAPETRPTELVSSCQTITIHDDRAIAIHFEHPPSSGVIPPAGDAEECLVIVHPRIIVQVEDEIPANAPKHGAELARKQLEALSTEYKTAEAAFRQTYRDAQTNQEREAASTRRPTRSSFVRQFFQIAKDYPDDPVAIDALVWIASEDMFWDGGEMALKILSEKHANSPQVAEYASSRHSRYGGPFAPYEQLLRATLKHRHGRDVEARINLSLANYLKMIKEDYDTSLLLLACDKRGGIGEQSRQNLKRWTNTGIDKLTTETEQLFKTLIVDYGDVKLDADDRTSIVEFASRQLHELRNLQIGSLAPNFEAKDVQGNPIQLSDLRGRVIVLDFGSHSGCGICSALYPELRELVQQFKDQPFELIGINQGDESEKLQELIRSENVTWRLVNDGDDWNGPISSKFAIDGMPTFYVIDHKGIVCGKGYFGLFEVLPELIGKLLAERDRDPAIQDKR